MFVLLKKLAEREVYEVFILGNAIIIRIFENLMH